MHLRTKNLSKYFKCIWLTKKNHPNRHKMETERQIAIRPVWLCVLCLHTKLVRLIFVFHGKNGKKIFRAQHLVNNNIGLVIRMLYWSHKVIKAELDRKKNSFRRKHTEIYERNLFRKKMHGFRWHVKLLFKMNRAIQTIRHWHKNCADIILCFSHFFLFGLFVKVLSFVFSSYFCEIYLKWVRLFSIHFAAVDGIAFCY